MLLFLRDAIKSGFNEGGDRGECFELLILAVIPLVLGSIFPNGWRFLLHLGYLSALWFGWVDGNGHALRDGEPPWLPIIPTALGLILGAYMIMAWAAGNWIFTGLRKTDTITAGDSEVNVRPEHKPKSKAKMSFQERVIARRRPK